MKDVVTRTFMIVVFAVWSMQLAASTLTDKDVRNAISLIGDSSNFNQEIERLVPELAERRAVRDQEREREMMQFMMSGEGNPSAISLGNLESDLREDMAILRKYPEANGILTKVVRQHGFNDGDDWIDTFVRVVRAYMAVSIDQPNPEIEETLAQMADFPGATQEGIDEMRAQMLGMQEAQRRYLSDVPEADKRAIAPFMDELNAATDHEEEGE